MVTVAVVSPGAMGSALGRVWQSGGARVVATVSGRSRRTHDLATGLELLPDLDAVVATADVVVSVCPPTAATEALTAILEAVRRTGARPVLADLNAISPETVQGLADRARAGGLDLVDGAISGAPPSPSDQPGSMLYLSGRRADVLAGLEAPGLRRRVVGPEVGQASGVKMCTASVYKGTTALWAQALETAERLGVREVVVADLAEEFPGTAAHAARLIALATSKSARFVGEMEQIAATQGAAGAAPELFEAMALVYRRLSTTALAELSPEEAAALTDLGDVLARLRPGTTD